VNCRRQKRVLTRREGRWPFSDLGPPKDRLFLILTDSVLEMLIPGSQFSTIVFQWTVGPLRDEKAGGPLPKLIWSSQRTVYFLYWLIRLFFWLCVLEMLIPGSQFSASSSVNRRSWKRVLTGREGRWPFTKTDLGPPKGRWHLGVA
jgi:hypothetical protein